MAPAKETECVSPSTTASVKPSWADLSEDLDLGLETDSQEREEERSAISDLESFAFRSLDIPKACDQDHGRRSHRDVASSNSKGSNSRTGSGSRNNSGSKSNGKCGSSNSSNGSKKKNVWTPTAMKWESSFDEENTAEGGDSEKHTETDDSSDELDFPRDHFSVQLDGLPACLCTTNCLDALLHTAGLSEYLLSRKVKMGTEHGSAIIVFSGWEAALACYQHFANSSWVDQSLQVTMHCPDEWTEDYSNWECAANHHHAEPLEAHEGYDCSSMGIIFYAATPVACEEWFGMEYDPNAEGAALAYDHSGETHAQMQTAHQRAVEAALAHAKDLKSSSRQTALYVEAA